MIDRIIALMKEAFKGCKVIGDWVPFVEKDGRILMDIVWKDEEMFVRSGDRATEMPVSILDMDGNPFSLTDDGKAMIRTLTGDMVLGDREKPTPDWIIANKEKRKVLDRAIDKMHKESKARPGYNDVVKKLNELGVHINTGDNETFYGMIWYNKRYYGYANPNTCSFSTHMSPQNMEARMAGRPREELFDLAITHGATVWAKDVEDVAVDDRTAEILFYLRDGRVVVFLPDPYSDPDMFLNFKREELDRTAEAMKKFDWNNTRWAE